MLDSLNALLEEQIKDLYSAENQLTKALPRMAKAATNPSLKEAFTSHLRETEGHVARVQKMAKALEITPGGKKCKAMEGLIEEGKEVLEEEGEDAVIDAALICAAQRVEHYEISAYGSLRALAEALGEDEIVRLAEEILEEEEAADEKLTKICEGEVIPEAMKAGEEEEGEDEGGSNGQDRGAAGRNGKAGKSGQRSKR